MSQENPALLARLGSVRRTLAGAQADALLLTDPTNVGYVSGFTGSTAHVLVSADDALLLTDARYTLRAHQECPHLSVVEASGSGGYAEKLQETLKARPALRRVGFEAGKVSVSQWRRLQQDSPSVEWVATDGLVEDLRMVKDAGEVEAIRAAIAVAEAAYQEIKPLLRPGVQEREIALELEFALRRGGADDRAFPTIVAGGAQGARPHHTPNERPLVPGDLVTIDWGAGKDGYHSDITRTVGIGRLTQEQRDVYALVLEAQQRAIAAIAPGKTGKEIDAVARDFFSAHGWGEAFSHGLGHQLGRQVHDGLGLSPRADKVVLRPGMVLTVEPGVYREHWGGIRIEEDILVTEQGCEVLTHLPNAVEVLG